MPPMTPEQYRALVEQAARSCPRDGRFKGGSVGAADLFRTSFGRLYFIAVLADPALAATVTIGNADPVPISPNTAWAMGYLECITLAPTTIQLGATLASYSLIWAP